MNVAITKQQLKELQSHRGDVDLDSDKVFANFKGALNIEDNRYHGEIVLTDPDPELQYQFFSLGKIVNDSQPQEIVVTSQDEEIKHGADSEHLD